jgi:hypothetical protein
MKYCGHTNQFFAPRSTRTTRSLALLPSPVPAKRAIQRRRRRATAGGTKEFKDGNDGNDGNDGTNGKERKDRKEGVANGRDHSINSTFDVTQMIRNEHRRGAESHERVRRLVRQHTRALGAVNSRMGREYIAPTERRRDDVSARGGGGHT